MAEKLNQDTARKPLKADQPGTSDDMVFKTPRAQFERTLRGLRETAQGCADATTTNATEWKSTKSVGIHKSALKDAMKIDNMSEDKRADYMRAFKAYCDWFKKYGGWEDQTDLVDAVKDSVDGEAFATGLGFMAGTKGVGSEKNPYAANDKDHDAWQNGWTGGQAVLMATSPLTNPDATQETAPH